ncbi:MAG: MerR family transcriptional regulator [Candidatus Obscuribacterales bacterium]|nr:MerR family transcriptional regulator [Candidatus Obscuribacterales bacterium]
MKTDETTLTLDELSNEVGQLLNQYALLGAQHDNRVSASPDARTIRYYTTLGLIDRPRINGRQAVYGKRHVLQILAIKALQAINLPLSEIQTRLYGRSNTELEALLTSLSEFWEKQESKQDKAEAVRSTIWHEVIIEPGVKILIQEGWQTQQDIEATLKRVRNALEAILPKEEQ